MSWDNSTLLEIEVKLPLLFDENSRPDHKPSKILIVWIIQYFGVII